MRQTALLASALLLVISAVAPAESPVAVSPGGTEEIMPIDQRCPTFNWTDVAGARAWELVVYRLPEGHEPMAEAAPVLRQTLPGGALGWTPPLAHCLVPGAQYAWSVRAEGERGIGEWSTPRLFEVASPPPPLELQQALRVLSRYLARGGTLEELGRQDGASSPDPTLRHDSPADNGDADSPPAASGGARLAPRGVTGSTAIRGEQSDASGASFGVVGTSASPDGAGVGAANSAGGADLILDGSADGQTDLLLNQSGIDRSSASQETFTLENTGGGGLLVRVEGEAQAASFSGDGSGLSNLDASNLSSGTVGASRGGLGFDSSSASSGAVLYAAATGSWTALPPGSDGMVLKMVGGAPAWGADATGGGGTVTSVDTGTGLTGGPITTSGTISIDTAVVPRLGNANTFTASQTVTSGSSATPGLIVQGAPSQTANLQEWRDDGGSLLSAIDSGGSFSGSCSSCASATNAENADQLDNLDSTAFAQLAAANTFLGAQSFTSTVSAADLDIVPGGSLDVTSGALLSVSGTSSLAATTITSATISAGSFDNGFFTNGSFSGVFAGNGSALSGIGRYYEASPLDGCHLVTDSAIKTPGVYCSNGAGGEVLCVSNSNDSPIDCSQLSDVNCRALCLDTSAASTNTTTLANLLIPSPGVVQTYLDRSLACHFSGSTLATMEQSLFCTGPPCTTGATYPVASWATAFPAETSPAPVWQALPGSSHGGVIAVASAGNYSLRLTTALATAFPYNSATCFPINQIDHQSPTINEDNALRALFTTPGELGTWQQ